MNLPVPLPAPDLPAPHHEAVDPASVGFPPMLPVELALAESPVREICGDYGIDKEEFAKMCGNAAFAKAVKDATEMLAKEGMSFRIKARMQSELLLKTSWNLIHAMHTPANVKADLIKSTFKVAGLEPRTDDKANFGPPLQINIQL